MTDRLADIKAALAPPRIGQQLFLEDEVRWLVAEVTRLQAQLDSTRADLHLTLKTAATQQDEIDALRQQAADMERGVADVLTSAIGDQDMGVVAGVGLLAERYAALRQRLPASMQGCTIVFRECAKGHGWLTATNWVDFPCPTCALAALRQRHAEAVHQAWLEAFEAGEDHARIPDGALDRDAAWLSSAAKARLT
jgi:hypothetical protein